MRSITLISLGIAPAIGLLTWFYLRRSRSGEYSRKILTLFTLGAIGAILFVCAASVSELLGINAMKNLKRILFFSFVTLAASAETGKFLALWVGTSGKGFKTSPLDNIVFSGMVSAGYATVVVPLFVFNFSGIGYYLPLNLFIYTYIPANLIFAVVLGFFTSISSHSGTRGLYSLTGLLNSILFHGLFAFCILTRDYKLLSMFAFGSVMVMFLLVMKAFFTSKDHQAS